jgi:HK97 gp10 family phage protein
VARQSVIILGLPELKTALASKVEELLAASTTVVRQEVDAIRDDAVRLAPRHTGALEEGIHAQASGPEGDVRSTARHSTFVEHGTYRNKAQPFMMPAANRARKRFPKRAADIIRAALGG